MKPEIWAMENLPRMERVLEELVAVPSAAGSPQPGAPYGAEPKRCLELFLKQAASLGFETRLSEDRMGEITFPGAKTPQLAVLGHLDVVPGWADGKYPAFTLTKENDTYYGRGVIDDKGPLVSALFALLYFLEQGISFKRPVMLLAGTNEECGSDDLAYYMERHPLPAQVITPDAAYPVINGEKGMLRFRLQKKVSASSLRALSGGEVINGVPLHARAEIKEPFELPALPAGTEAAWEENALCLTGQSAHASTPELGVNALTALWSVLAKALSASPQGEALAALCRLFPHGAVRGEGFSLACSDEVSGFLTMVPSLCRYDGELLQVDGDVRFPIDRTVQEISAAMRQKAAEMGFDFTALLADEPHYTPADSPLVQTLLDVYQAHTGKPGKCVSIGGGTYVHNVPGGVAFGVEREGYDYHMHGTDERLPASELIDNTVLYIKALLALGGEAGKGNRHER